LCQKADICTAASELRGYSITSSAGALKIGRNEHYGEGRKRANIHADFVCGISVRMSGDPPGAVAGKTATFDPADAGWEQHADEGFLGLVGPIWRRPDGYSYRYAFLAEAHALARLHGRRANGRRACGGDRERDLEDVGEGVSPKANVAKAASILPRFACKPAVCSGSSSTHAVETTRPCLSAAPGKRPSQIEM